MAALGLTLLLAETLALPACRGDATTSSGETSCRIDRADRSSEYLLAAGVRLRVPVPEVLGSFLLIAGLAGVSALPTLPRA